MFLDNNKNDKKPIKNREAPGYGYDKSVDDLKVIGKNRDTKRNNQHIDRKETQ